MKNLIKRLETIAHEIDSNPHLRLSCFEYNSPLTLKNIQQFVEAEFEIELSNSFKEIFTNVNGFKLEWEVISKPDGTPIDEELEVTGRICIHDLYTIFEGPDGEEWKNIIWTEDMPSNEKEEMKSFKSFDFFDPDDGGHVCLVLREGKLENHLILKSTDYGIKYLEIDPISYLNTALYSRGYYRWQFFVSPITELYGFQIKLEQMRSHLSTYFPDCSLEWIKDSDLGNQSM